jgi:hypothetical protein
MEFIVCAAYDASALITLPDFDLYRGGNDTSRYWISAWPSIDILISFDSH